MKDAILHTTITDLLPGLHTLSEGDLSALLTLLAVPAGGAIAIVILWAVLRP